METPVGTLVEEVDARLAEGLDVPVFAMSETDLDQALSLAAQAQARLAALTLRLAGQLDRVAPDAHARWSHHTRQTKRGTHRRLSLARALEERPVLAEAMARGEVSEEQATVIARALDALPVSVDAETTALAEKQLVADAADFDPDRLRVLGRRILDVIAPEVGEEQQRRALEAEERAAERTTWLHLSDDGDGTSHLRGRVPTRYAAMLRKSLLALASPHRTGAVHAGSPERLGHALCELIERYPTNKLPQAGGVNASVVVTMTLADLLGHTHAPALLDTGQQITAGEARRLACNAGIIPAVLSGRSEVLDLGRVRRLHSPAQRHAIALRDRTCTAEGCDYPPAMCHVHHDHPWAQGGKTTVDDGHLLCPKHHRMVHSGRLRLKHLPNGRVVFART